MPIEDFGYGEEPIIGAPANGEEGSVTDLNTGNQTDPNSDANVDDLNNNNTPSEPNADDNGGDETGEETNDSLPEGTKLEVGDKTYTVDKDGNIVDDNGNIFKKKEEVAEWRKSFEGEEDVTDEITLDSIQKALDIQITDENDKPVQFENTPEGIKSYIEAVIETGREELQRDAINALMAKYSFLPEIINYYTANGNSLEGYGRRPDRSGITIDSQNEEQQIAIIKAAWKERGQRGDVNGYIDYLKNSGTLLTTAEAELQGLKDSDKAAKDEIARKAAEVEKQQQEELKNYWNGVKSVIDNREIAGYKIPEQIVVNRNGQKTTATPDDFFRYLYLVDKEGHSAYERDLLKSKPEDRLNDELLKAFLTFTGGNYSNLVDYAINEKQVKTLRLKAKQGSKGGTLRITKPAKKESKDIDFGY